MAQFYGSLYNLHNNKGTHQPTEQDIQDILTQAQLPSLTPTQRESLQAPISLTELTHTIKTLPLGKSPGPDGFTNQNYKTFSGLLAPYHLKTLNHIVTMEKLLAEMLVAHIATLPKPGKPPTICQNL
ncbi:Hypothetical predicted protein [Pelobates cultripes]|uniref:Reverse transcriptase n=1 Tax=Pelobates cultripes TaxID=61616 RepID=A0AAD1VKH8_PELCU|nr:Hypothetical predicted protein [Pelobates cultripes]